MGDHWVLLKGTGTLMAPSVYTWDVSRLCVLLAALCVGLLGPKRREGERAFARQQLRRESQGQLAR